MKRPQTEQDKNFFKFIKFLKEQVPAEKFDINLSILYGTAQSYIKVTKENLHVCNTAACIFGWGHIYTAMEQKLDVVISDVLSSCMTVPELGRSLSLDTKMFYSLCYGVNSIYRHNSAAWSAMSLSTAIECLYALRKWTHTGWQCPETVESWRIANPFSTIVMEIINAAYLKQTTPTEH